MPKTKKKRKIYFGQEVQDAIVDYNTTDKSSEKNTIYETRIHKAFDKLAENIINTFKFSYFSVVAKNYLILHNNTNYKRKIKMVDIADVKHSNKHATSMNKNTFLTDFTDELVDYFEIHMTSIFKKQIDIDIAYALLEILKRRDEIENFNKKSLYILIKEMTQVNTAKITNVVNVMKKHYKKVFNKFYDVGIVN